MPKAAVLGSPIAHSKSPLLHTAAYRALGLAWEYDRHEVAEDGLEGFLAEHAGEYRGLSLTMPLKYRAYALSRVHDAAAEATGAVNTLVFGDDVQGHNTDVVGFIEALHAVDVTQPAAATIIGTGATARSAAYAMIMDGVTELHIVGRRPDALEAMRAWLPSTTVELHTHLWEEPTPATPVTISTTTAHATDGRALPDTTGVLFESIYAPWPTDHAARWQAAGGRVLSGLDLLVHQAAQQVILMTRVHPDNRGAIVAAMYAALGGTLTAA